MSWTEEERRDDQILISDEALTVFDDYECRPCEIPLRVSDEVVNNHPGTM